MAEPVILRRVGGPCSRRVLCQNERRPATEVARALIISALEQLAGHGRAILCQRGRAPPRGGISNLCTITFRRRSRSSSATSKSA
jgi:hypothetical protein